ncbi:MAG: DNA primase [Acidobacteriota bacterium]
MALFPASFVDDLKAQTNIVSVIGDVVSLKKTGNTLKGLCPFHTEKTPSFNVNADKGFFKCFGCGVGGDVVKFVELYQKLPFPEAVRYLATRASMTIPEADGSPEDRAAAADRESIIKLHEQAAAFFASQLASPMGLRARRELEKRGLSAITIETFRYGYAPAGGRETLHAVFNGQGVPLPLQLRSGLVRQWEGRVSDYFRNRLLIPIARDTGAVVAFGARALEEGQNPKYLNSPETPVYSKGRTLYGLDVTKSAIRTKNYCVLVEGYFDFAQVWQAGVQNVAAICGTALTVPQIRILKRFTSKVVLSLDPDTAGQGATTRSAELLVGEGFDVNVALLPAGGDPDTFIRRSGPTAYVERLKGSQSYLDFLLDRSAAGLDLTRPESRKKFLGEMLTVAATIPDAAERDQFADRLAHKAKITESVIRDEIRKAAAQRKTQAPAIAVSTSVRVLPSEQGLLWTLVHRPVEGLAAVSQLEVGDLDGLMAAPVFRLAASLADMPPEVLPELLRERLNEGDRGLLERAAASEAPAGGPAECVNALRRLRIVRELAGVQNEIDRLPQASQIDDDPLAILWEQKKVLLRQLEALASE